MQHSPHLFPLLLVTYPALQVTLEERCCSEDLSAVLFIPYTFILNCPVATAYFIWNRTASLFSWTSSLNELLPRASLTINEKRISIAWLTARLFLFLSANSHPGTVSFVNWQAWHPEIVESVSLTAFLTALSKSLWVFMFPQLIPLNLTEKWCSISLGAASPVWKWRKQKKVMLLEWVEYRFVNSSLAIRNERRWVHFLWKSYLFYKT